MIYTRACLASKGVSVLVWSIRCLGYQIIISRSKCFFIYHAIINHKHKKSGYLILEKKRGKNKSTMYNQHLPRIPLQPRRQLPLTNLQLGTNLIKTMHPIQILDQTLIIDEIVFCVSIALSFSFSPVVHHTLTLHRRRLLV